MSSLPPCPQCPSLVNPNAYGPVAPSGPTPCQYMFIGEAPHKDELRWRKPFAGRTGKELDGLYLPLSGLTRSKVYVTYAHKCLRGDTLVWMADGSWKRISQLFHQKSHEQVMAITENGRVCRSHILGHYRSPRADRKLVRLSYQGYKCQGGKSDWANTVVTEDHKVLTRREDGKQPESWVAASDLALSDHICTGTPGLDHSQMGFVVGMLLGDCSLTRRNMTITHVKRDTEYSRAKIMSMSNIRWHEFIGDTTITQVSEPLPVFEKLSQSWGRSGPRSRSLDIECIKQHFSFISLIIWFLDDGSTYKTESGNYVSSIRCSRLSEDQIDFMVSVIRDKCGIQASSGSGRIYFGIEQSKWLRRVASVFTPGSMAYKLGDAPHNHLKESLYRCRGSEPYYAPVLFEETNPRQVNGYETDKSVYCLSTSHENFITRAGVVHNCPRPNFKNPTKEESAVCSDYHLHTELRQCQPEIIIPMGAVACSLFGDQIHLESQHGIPFKGQLYDWEGWVFPTYHPAIGLHDGSWMQIMMDDFRELGAFLLHQGTQTRVEDKYPNPYYRELITVADLDRVFGDAQQREILDQCAIDTEATPKAYYGSISQRWNPYCLSFTFRPGTGYAIYADNRGVLEQFIRYTAVLNPLWIIHNSLFDLDILRLLSIPIRRYDDTIVRAYNLQRIPKGLKPLAFRLCGLRMDDFDDVVTPYSRDVILDWVSSSASLLRDIMFDPNGKSGRPLKTPRRLPEYSTEQARTLNKMEKILNDWNTCDPWARWSDWHDWDREFVSTFFGPMPRKSIAHCPRNISTPYACADADATIRILPALKSLATDLRRYVEVS